MTSNISTGAPAFPLYTRYECDASGIAVAQLDSKLAFLGMSSAMARLAGQPIEQLLGNSLSTVFPEMADLVHQILMRTPGSEYGVQEHLATLRSNCEQIKVKVGIYPLYRTSDTWNSFQMVVFPIRERPDTEDSLARRLEFEELITEISGLLAGLPNEEVDTAISRSIRRMVEYLGLDRSTLFEVVEAGDEVHTRLSYSRPGIKEAPLIRVDNLFPWMWSQLRDNEIVSLVDRHEIPSDAVLDRESMYSLGPRAIVVMPIHLGGRLAFLYTLESFGDVDAWPPALVSRQRLAGELIGMTFARKSAYMELKQRLDFERVLREISSLFVNPSPDQFDNDLDAALRLVVVLTDVGRCGVALFSSDGMQVRTCHAHEKGGFALSPETISREALPWLVAQISEGRRVHIASIDDLPPEGALEAEMMQVEGIRSYVALPLCVHDRVMGFLSLAALDEESSLHLSASNSRTVHGETLSPCKRSPPRSRFRQTRLFSPWSCHRGRNDTSS